MIHAATVWLDSPGTVPRPELAGVVKKEKEAHICLLRSLQSRFVS